MFLLVLGKTESGMPHSQKRLPSLRPEGGPIGLSPRLWERASQSRWYQRSWLCKCWENWAPAPAAAVGILLPGWSCIVELMLPGISEEAHKECMWRSVSPFWSLVSQSSSIFLWKGSPGWRSLADLMLIKPLQLGSLPAATREQERASPCLFL